MSKSIWHRYDETPKHQDIIMTDTGCWAYRADLLSLETELERTRKALDVAVDALNAGKTLADIAGFKMLVAGLEEALNKITALEQKDK